MTNALLLDEFEGAGGGTPLARTHLGSARYDEAWLQRLLFSHPDLVPLDQADPGAGPFIPLCREFPLPREGGIVFPDLLGVTRSGRLVIVECKLWRNPQARREVVAQALDYAALLRGWSYGDLTARLVSTKGMTGDNPIFARARERCPELHEATFVDALTRSLATGDFQLIIAGDGIRSDLHAVASYLNANAGGIARLSLVEIQLWEEPGGRVVVLPNLPMRTEIVPLQVLFGPDRSVLRLEVGPGDGNGAAPASAPDPERSAERERNRAFWQRFIDSVQFNHPDQPKPRHGGNNWVRMDLPSPASWLTGFRDFDSVGLFVRLRGEAGRALFDTLSSEAESLREESGLDLEFRPVGPKNEDATVIVVHSGHLHGAFTEEEQLAWLSRGADALVSALRPRISSWNEQAG